MITLGRYLISRFTARSRVFNFAKSAFWTGHRLRTLRVRTYYNAFLNLKAINHSKTFSRRPFTTGTFGISSTF